MDVLEDRFAEKVRYRRRRAALRRAKAKAYRQAQLVYPFPGWPTWDWDEICIARAEYAYRHYRNRAKSSNWFHGSQRRYAKGDEAVTLQERREELRYKDECEV